MNIIQRNGIRLLREGAFNEHLPLEPMSTWKWNRVLDFAQAHDLTPWVYEGILLSADDFFLHIDGKQRDRWQQAVANAYSEQAAYNSERLEEKEQHFSNPLLNWKLRRLLRRAERELPVESRQATTAFMLRLVGLARILLSQGIHLRQITELAIYLRTTHDDIDYGRIRTWIVKLHMKQMASLTASLLVSLFDFTADEIPFAKASSPKEAQRFIREFNVRSFLLRGYCDIRRLYLFPQESPFNLVRYLFHSLAHIEE